MSRSVIAMVALVAAAGCTASSSPAGPADGAGAVGIRSAGQHRPGSHPARRPGRHGVGHPGHQPAGVRVLPAGVVLPDPVRTPGARNRAVSQSTIDETICRTGYTSTIRPPSSYTTDLKERQLATGYAWRGDRDLGDYEEDHLIALELGGAPAAVANLWPEPYAARRGADTKDLVENRLHDLVCAGALRLRAAQRAIARNWWAAYRTYGGVAVPHVYDGRYESSSGSPTGRHGRDPRFATCAEAIAHGYGPYVRGTDPEYWWYRDGDGDGTDCEK